MRRTALLGGAIVAAALLTGCATAPDDRNTVPEWASSGTPSSTPSTPSTPSTTPSDLSSSLPEPAADEDGAGAAIAACRLIMDNTNTYPIERSVLSQAREHVHRAAGLDSTLRPLADVIDALHEDVYTPASKWTDGWHAFNDLTAQCWDLGVPKRPLDQN